jgi:predicted acetyltransferase
MKGTSVAPLERGKGVYRALLQHRVAILHKLGIPLATVQAIVDTSAPICRKFGFEKVCTI